MTTRAFAIESIELRELKALDLRAEAVKLQWAERDDDISREDLDAILDGLSTQEPFVQHPALAYMVCIEGEATIADVLVATETHRVGIAWGGDAAWVDVRDSCDLTTEAGGDSFAAALRQAVDGWLNAAVEA